MGDFEKALRKVQQRQMTHEDRSTGDQRVRDAMKSMEEFVIPQSPAEAAMMLALGPIGGKLFKGASLAAGAMASNDAEASLNPRYILKELIDKVRSPAGFKDRSKYVEMSPDDFLSLAHPLENIDPVYINKLVEDLKNNKLKNNLQLWFNRTDDPNVAKIVGHEGRHRALAAKKLKMANVPVEVRGDIRWSEQSDPNNFDYLTDWPTRLLDEQGVRSTPFPFERIDDTSPFGIIEKGLGKEARDLAEELGRKTRETGREWAGASGGNPPIMGGRGEVDMPSIGRDIDNNRWWMHTHPPEGGSTGFSSHDIGMRALSSPSKTPTALVVPTGDEFSSLVLSASNKALPYVNNSSDLLWNIRNLISEEPEFRKLLQQYSGSSEPYINDYVPWLFSRKVADDTGSSLTSAIHDPYMGGRIEGALEELYLNIYPELDKLVK